MSDEYTAPDDKFAHEKFTSEHFRCDCVPSIGPAHCHGCGNLAGHPVAWADRSCATAAPATRNSDRVSPGSEVPATNDPCEKLCGKLSHEPAPCFAEVPVDEGTKPWVHLNLDAPIPYSGTTADYWVGFLDDRTTDDFREDSAWRFVEEHLRAAAREGFDRWLATELQKARAEVTPEHLMQDGLVNYLTRNSNGVWWVSTRKNNEPWSGMPLDRFLRPQEPPTGEQQ